MKISIYIGYNISTTTTFTLCPQTVDIGYQVTPVYIVQSLVLQGGQAAVMYNPRTSVIVLFSRRV